MNEKNTAIITCIDGRLDENLENDFLTTLSNESDYKGHIIILDYGIKSEVKKRIAAKYNATFYEFKKTNPVFNLRYKHLPIVIKKIPKEITNIMLIDSGDIWFQKSIEPIFNLTEKRIGCVDEPIIFGEDEWINLCLANLPVADRELILSNSKGKRNKNAGMICGPRNDIYTLVKNIYEYMIFIGIEFFGLDQLFFNYEINKMNEHQFIVLNKEFNYVLVTYKDFIYKNKKIYTENDNLVTVVHNAGGNWRVFNRKFGNIKHEEEQYMCNNLRQW